MKIPKQLKIGGHTFQVKLVPKNIFSDSDTVGFCSLDDNTISIAESLTQSQKEAALLHEIMHAMNWCLEENILESLSQQFYQVLKDNKLSFQ